MSQSRKRTLRAKKFIIKCLRNGHLPHNPLGRLDGSVCKAKRARQTKRCDFKGLRGELFLITLRKASSYESKYCVFNGIHGKQVSEPATPLFSCSSTQTSRFSPGLRTGHL